VLENIADVPKLAMPAFEQGKIILFVCTADKLNVTSVQELLLWFWQTKGSLDVR
jgi:hypothetical protein